MTHHMLSTLIPLIDVTALGGTLVSMMRFVFWIHEKHNKNRDTKSAVKNQRNLVK